MRALSALGDNVRAGCMEATEGRINRACGF